MIKGILFGLLYNVVVAVGLYYISEARTPANPIIKASIMLVVSGLIALLLLLATMFFNKEILPEIISIDRKGVLLILAGSFLVLVVGEWLYISGLDVSNVTTMSLAALAFPATALAVEIVFKRIPVSSLTLQDLFGFILLSSGFLLLTLRK